MDQDQSDEATSQDNNSNIISKTRPPKSVATEPSVSSLASPGLVSGMLKVPSSATTSSSSLSTLLHGQSPRTVLSGTASARAVTEEAAASLCSSLENTSNVVMKDDNSSFSSTIPNIGAEKGVSREMSNQEPVSGPLCLSTVGGFPSSGAVALVPQSELSKRNISSVDERVEGVSITPTFASQLSGIMFSQHVSKINDGILSNDSVNQVPGIGGRAFSHSIATSQWRPPTASAFQTQTEVFPTSTYVFSFQLLSELITFNCV